MYKRRRKQRTLHLPEVNVIPLIDVSLMLLLVFMITAPMIRQGIKVDLPHGKSQETKDLKEDLTVFLDKSGGMHLNDKKVTDEQLMNLLSKKATESASNTVFVKADRAVHYGKVIELVDRIKYVAGLKYVALSTVRS